MIGLGELNALPQAAFATALGAVFEHSPWVAQRSASARPFASVVALTAAMRAVVAAAAPAEQLALIRAHPRLGARGLQLASLTSASQGEQRRAGLAACSDEEYAQLLALNERYVARFDFPFILAVRGHAPASIIACCRQRLAHECAEEQRTALTQIGLIAGFRLADLVRSTPGAELLGMQAALAGAQGAARQALLAEWLLAAHLEVRYGPAGDPLATLDAPAGAGPPLLLGSPGEAILGIALARELRNRGQDATRALVLEPLSGHSASGIWGQAGLAVPSLAPTVQQSQQIRLLWSLVTSSGESAHA